MAKWQRRVKNEFAWVGDALVEWGWLMLIYENIVEAFVCGIIKVVSMLVCAANIPRHIIIRVYRFSFVKNAETFRLDIKFFHI